MSLLTASQIAAVTGITEGDLPADIITWAESRVEKKLDKNYTEKSNTYTFYLDTAQSYVKMPHRSLISVSSFTIEDVDEDGLSESDNEFYVFKDEGIIYSDYFTTFKEISITYTYGNETAEDLDKYLHLLYVLKMLVTNYPSLLTKTKVKEKIGDYSVEYATAELKEHPSMIDREINTVISDSDTTGFYFI